MSLHTNNGNCLYCRKIIGRYPKFHKELALWFVGFQARHPEAHVSCAGRNRIDQEDCVLKGSSEAHWTESAHNWNCALDLFEQGGKSAKDIYEKDWFRDVLIPELPDWVEWYGRKGAKFREWPHIEVKNWRKLIPSGQIVLVDVEEDIKSA